MVTTSWFGRLTLVFVAVAPLLLVTASPADSHSGETVGGPLLSERGVVAHSGGGVSDPPRVRASAYLVAHLEDDQVLAAKDAHGQYRPASTLKVLTALALIPRLDPTKKVRVTRDDAYIEGTKVGIMPGTRYRVSDLFRGLLMTSGNDAARALARVAGGTRQTLKRMNAEAKRIQANDTVAKSASGLDKPGQYTSVYDMALITKAALEYESFRRYIGTERAAFPAPGGKSYQIQNHNDLLTTYRGAIGGKTGYTTKADGTYVGIAKRNGRTIIVALLHAYPDYWSDVRNLLDWGFNAAGEAQPVGELADPIPDQAKARPEQPQPGAEPAQPPGNQPQTDPSLRSIPESIQTGFERPIVIGIGLAIAIAALSALVLAYPRPRRSRGRRRRGRPRL